MAAAEKQEDPLILNNYIHEQKQQQQQLMKRGDLPSIKCPRCNSSNTKFCYYNNYSLSQPRHLCKACKRYWTRGGTLRNVPAAGSSRKRPRNNKTTTTKPNIGLIQQPEDRHKNHVNNPLFINSLQPTNPDDLQVLNFPFYSRLTRVLSSGSDDDQRPEMNGIGFSSSGFNMASDQLQITNTTDYHHNQNNGSSSSKQIQDAAITNNYSNCSFASTFGFFKDYDDTQNDYFPGLMPNYQDIHHILPTGGLINGGIVFNNLERENITNIHQIQHLDSSLLSKTSNSSSCFQLDP